MYPRILSMSTAKRRSGHSLHLELPDGLSADLPPVAAVFLVLFDARTGYKVAWKRSIPGLELTESVEFKSLPSGLHHVEEDLVYFVHDEEYAGISAFVNKPDAESERNALMLAVGALVPLSYGRMGKSWKYAEELMGLARTLVNDPEELQPLEDFWTEYQSTDDNESTKPSSQNGSSSADQDRRGQERVSPNQHEQTRNRAMSTASALAPLGKGLSSHHPALSLSIFLDTFGPLIFPLYKAALLRKRILLVGHAPVELSCNFVYNISVLSGIPASVIDLPPLEPLPTRLNPLFSVGVHDISILTTSSRTSDSSPSQTSDNLGYGWVACTTDDILAQKPHLYDTLVALAPPHSARATEKSWPRLSSKQNSEIKATQRDYRRYRTLRGDLRTYNSSHSPYASATADPEASPSALPELNQQETFDDASSTIDDRLIEPQSWSALAYSSFMWWASAGEKRTDLDEESDHDSALLRDFEGRSGSAHGKSPQRSMSANGMLKSPGAGLAEDVGLEMALIAYFHRFTSLMFRVLAEVIDRGNRDESGFHDEDDLRDDSAALQPAVGADSRSGEDETLLREKEIVYVSSEDLTRMGLDVWSESDRKFVEELIGLYWGREAVVEGGRVECCGIRVC